VSRPGGQAIVDAHGDTAVIGQIRDLHP
jgi:hypothetical protein